MGSHPRLDQAVCFVGGGGTFGTVTKTRTEYVIEGTLAALSR